MPPLQETKECPYCAEIILVRAIKCRYCGEMLDSTPVDALPLKGAGTALTPQRLWNPGVAGLLSLLIPGAGQMYRGKVGAGLLWLVCVPLGYILIIPGLALHIICIFNAASGDPTVDGRESARLTGWFAAAALSLACVAGGIIYLAIYHNPGHRQFEQPQPLAFIPPSQTPQPTPGEQEESTPSPSPSVSPSVEPSVEPTAEAQNETPVPLPSPDELAANNLVASRSSSSNPPPPAASVSRNPDAAVTRSNSIEVTDKLSNVSLAQQHYQSGLALMKQQRWKEAENEFREAVRLKPDNPYYRFQLGAALSPQMRFAETEAEFRAAARLDAANALWHAKLGYILSVQKKWAEAEREAFEAVRLDPANTGYQTLLQNVQRKR